MQERDYVSFDPDAQLATFFGPGGFTQVPMDERKARAIAEALRIKFEVRAVIVRG